MNKIEKILDLLEKQGEQLAAIDKRLMKVEATQAEQGKQLATIDKRLMKVETTQAEQGKQLAEQGDRLLKIEMNIEHTIIPRLDTLYEGQQLMKETFARKEDIETIKDAMIETETATNISLSQVWSHIAKLEKAN